MHPKKVQSCYRYRLAKMSFRRNILIELNEEVQMAEQQIDPLKAKLIEDGKRGFEISSYEKQLIDLKSTHIKLSKQIQKIHQNGLESEALKSFLLR